MPSDWARSTLGHVAEIELGRLAALDPPISARPPASRAVRRGVGAQVVGELVPGARRPAELAAGLGASCGLQLTRDARPSERS